MRWSGWCPDPSMEPRVKAAVKRARGASTMRVASAAGTDLTVDMREASTVGVWGWSDRPARWRTGRPAWW